MAIINLDVEKILSISNELNSLDTTLLNSYVPELKDIINQIKSNVLNEQVNSILGTISSQVDSISGELAVDLPKLEQFLDTQMQSYQTTEADAQAKLQAVVNTMGGFAGMQPLNIDGGGSAPAPSGGGTAPSGGENAPSGGTTTSGGSGKANDNSIYGAMGASALGGAAVGAAVGGPIGAAVGGVIGAAAPVAVDLAGKAVSGVGWCLNKVGSWAEGLFQW